jgi:hypothetical protein
VRIARRNSEAIEPALLLFAAFVVHRPAVNPDCSVGGATAALAATSSGATSSG